MHEGFPIPEVQMKPEFHFSIIGFTSLPAQGTGKCGPTLKINKQVPDLIVVIELNMR
jgi:hypothetical protein